MDINAILAAGILIAAIFVLTAVPVLRRMKASSENNFAEATVLEKKINKPTINSEDSSVAGQRQELTLKLEVRPLNGLPYTAQATYLTNAVDMTSLEPGAVVHVSIDHRDPTNILILPEMPVAPFKIP